MTIEKFIQVLSQQVFAQSAGAELSPETEFKKLPEWSSLVALILIASIEDEFDVVLKSKDLLGSTTVRDLFDAAVAKKG